MKQVEIKCPIGSLYEAVKYFSSNIADIVMSYHAYPWLFPTYILFDLKEKERKEYVFRCGNNKEYDEFNKLKDMVLNEYGMIENIDTELKNEAVKYLRRVKKYTRATESNENTLDLMLSLSPVMPRLCDVKDSSLLYKIPDRFKTMKSKEQSSTEWYIIDNIFMVKSYEDLAALILFPYKRSISNMNIVYRILENVRIKIFDDILTVPEASYNIFDYMIDHDSINIGPYTIETANRESIPAKIRDISTDKNVYTVKGPGINMLYMGRTAIETGTREEADIDRIENYLKEYNKSIEIKEINIADKANQK